MNKIKLDRIKKEFYFFNGYKDTFLYHFGLAKLLNLNLSNKFVALDNISMEISQGERVAILGKNGSGKSTLLKIISGFIMPTSGSISVKGSIAALFSIDGGGNECLTGRENIQKAAVLYSIPKEQFDFYLNDILEFSELSDVIDDPVYSYSLGMKMRLQFAIATSIFPDILIVDEVLGAGDSYFLNKSHKRIDNLLSRKCTLIMVSHSMKAVENLCDRAILLDKGRMILDDAPQKIIGEYLAHTASISIPKGEKSQWNVVPLSNRPHFITQCVNEIEARCHNVLFLKNKIEDREVDCFLKKNQNLLSFNCQFYSAHAPLLYPNDNFLCQFLLNVNSNVKKVVIKFYHQSCKCVGQFDFNVQSDDKDAKKRIDLLLKPILFGSGDYQISFALLDEDDNLLELYPNIYSFLINYSNDSDPPMLHLPGQWCFDEERVEARISPYQ